MKIPKITGHPKHTISHFTQVHRIQSESKTNYRAFHVLHKIPRNSKHIIKNSVKVYKNPRNSTKNMTNSMKVYKNSRISKQITRNSMEIHKIPGTSKQINRYSMRAQACGTCQRAEQLPIREQEQFLRRKEGHPDLPRTTQRLNIILTVCQICNRNPYLILPEISSCNFTCWKQNG